MPDTVQLKDGTQLDGKVVKVMKAIRKIESGGDYNAVGDLDRGVSRGAYQFNKDNFKNWAKESNLDPNDFSPANQNKVAYARIKKFKDEGKQPDEIAALWNGAKKTPEGKYTYINPVYGERFRSALQEGNTPTQNSGVGGSYVAPPEVKPFTPADPKVSGETPTKDKGLVQKGLEFLFPILEKKDRTGLQFAGDLAMSALTLVPGAGAVGLGAKGLKAASLLSKGAKAVKGAEEASAAAKGIRGAISAKNIGIGAGTGYGYDVASNLSQGKTGAGEVLTPGLGTALGAATGGLVRKSPTAQFSKIVNDLTPELTKGKGIAALAKGGTIQSGIKGLISPKIAPSTKTVAQVVQKHVPEFGNLKTFSDKLNATRSAITRLAEDLKAQVIKNGEDIIYPFKELNKRLTNIKKPIEIRADPVQARKFDLARQAAMRIAKEKGGKISNLFDARKEFDNLVEKEFPNLYDRANAPMRSAITAIRREMNDFIEEQLSKKGVKYSESLKDQSRLFDAVDNLAPKAWGEVGTTRLGRFAEQHPLLSQGAKAAGAGLLGGLGFQGASNLIKD